MRSPAHVVVKGISSFRVLSSDYWYVFNSILGDGVVHLSNPSQVSSFHQSQGAARMVNPHFDDTIKVIGVDGDGKKYDKVSRVEARGEESDMHILVDVNSQLYPMHAGEKYRMVLSQTLNEDGPAITNNSQGNKKSLADRFEYVMHGLLYKISDDKNQNGDAEVAVYISFGGLQLLMKGTPVKMGKFKVDQRLFVLLLKE